VGFTRDPGTGENVLYGKMNAVAQVRTSVEMEKQGIITKAQALLRVAPESLEQMLFPRLDPKAKVTAVASGLPASPGAASGIAVFDADRAEMLGKEQGFKDFKALFEVMSPFPVVIRLLDPPIHEFLPNEAVLERMGWYARSPSCSSWPRTPTA